MTRMSDEPMGCSLPSRSVHVRAVEQVAHDVRDGPRLLGRVGVVPAGLVFHGDEADALPICQSDASQGLPLVAGLRQQCRRVEDLRGELADLRMQPPGPVHEEPEARRHDRGIAEQMAERAPLGADGMRALQRLVELLGIAEHDQRGCRR